MTRERVFADSDILSIFAKADALNVFGAFLGEGRVVMTPAVRDEISIPLQYGYVFPKAIFASIPIIPMQEEIWKEFERLRIITSSLGKGELESIAFCIIEGALFATNDSAARKFALSQGVFVISLQAMLRGLWIGDVLSKREVKDLLERIKKTDYLEVLPHVEEEIFDEEI